MGRIKRIRTIVSGARKALAEGHVGWKIFRMTKADIEVSLVVIPDTPEAKMLFDRVRVEKMVWNEKVATRFIKMVVSGITKA